MRKLTILLENMDMPEDIQGATSKKNDTFYMLINAKASKEEQAAAFLHEMLHIYRRDFESDQSVDEIEIEVRKELKVIKQYL